MKFTLSWLKEFLDTDADLAAIDKTLTSIGLEVEEITDASAALAPFTVAEILHAEKHPDADKLQICKVNSNEGELQIVCGAPNARAGLKVALAKVGAVIPNGEFKIKKSKIRGVESCGMLCSADELGIGGDAKGIIELPENAQIGDSVVDILGLNDPMIEIAITPNRGDCLGIYGIARDLAAAGLGTLKPLATSTIKASENAPVSISIEDDNCKVFVGRVIKGVKNPESPDWLKQKLAAIGLRPISTLVDITNYITFTYGRPLHVYDVSKLNGNIIVRSGKEGEAFEALNDKSYILKGGECVIADDTGMLGLGGVVGGVPSGVTEETTDVLLECAWFDPIHIAEVGRAHSIDSDARYRFERTVDPDFVLKGADIATQMILDLCGGTPCEQYVAGAEPIETETVNTSADFINQLGGISLSTDEMNEVLSKLGFSCETSGAELSITVPTWRPDVTQPADIAEEVLRIYGYDSVEAVPMPKQAGVSPAAWDGIQQRSATVRRTLAGRGIHETHTWAFLAEDDATLFGYNDSNLALVNPISSDLSVMRPSLLPNLIHAARRNQARGFDSINLFEVGPTFKNPTPKGQQTVAAAVRLGKASRKQWAQDDRDIDAYDAKADALAIIESCGLNADKVQINTNVPDYYHPGRSGAITLGPKNILAYFGELHPATLQALNIDERMAACEVVLDAIPMPKKKANTALRSSDYQAADRDFAFLIDADTSASTLLRAVRGADKELVKQVRLFDSYQGKGVEDGKKSLAITIRLQAEDRTLTEADIEAVAKKVTESAEKAGAKLRA